MLRGHVVDIIGSNVKSIQQSPWGIDETRFYPCFEIYPKTSYSIKLINNEIVKYDAYLFINNISMGTWRINAQSSITIDKQNNANSNSNFMFINGANLHNIITIVFNAVKEDAVGKCGANSYPLKHDRHNPLMRHIGQFKATKLNIKLV